MSFFSTSSTRAVLKEVVRDVRFRPLTKIPLVAPAEIGLILAAFLLFAAATTLYVRDILPWMLMLPVNGFAIYLSFTPLHDATHRTLSSNRSLNDALGSLSCLLLLPGITTRIYRYLHLEHHRHTGAPGLDPDEILVSAPTWQLPLVLASVDVVWTCWYISHRAQRPASEQRAFAVSILIYLVFHAAWLASPYWQEFILAWVIPQRIGLLVVTYFFAHIQHPKHVTWEQTPFQATVRLTVPRWIQVMLLGQAQHCMHHFAPSLPFYRYHRAWALGRHLLEQQGIPTRTLFTPSQNLVRTTPDTAPLWLVARVTAVNDAAQDVRSFDLTPDIAAAWPGFTAGAHVDLEVAPGLVRQYSLCSPPEKCTTFRIAVKREDNGRGASRRLHETVTTGDTLRISLPRNTFPLNMHMSAYVLIAGGVGATPLISMAHALDAAGKPFALHLFASSPEQVIFRQTLQTLFPNRVHLHFNRSEALAAAGPYCPGSALYLCGPAGFMAQVITAAHASAWPAEAIFSESFTPARRDNIEDRPFEVELRKSGRILTVPVGQSLLEVLHANGHSVICSCTQGICGSCLTPVLEGIPDHRDAILTDTERAQNRQMTVCVSRALSTRLTLDL